MVTSCARCSCCPHQALSQDTLTLPPYVRYACCTCSACSAPALHVVLAHRVCCSQHHGAARWLLVTVNVRHAAAFQPVGHGAECSHHIGHDASRGAGAGRRGAGCGAEQPSGGQPRLQGGRQRALQCRVAQRCGRGGGS